MVCSCFAVYVLANNTVCTILPPLCMAKGDHAQFRIWYKLCIILGTNVEHDNHLPSCHHFKVHFYLRSTDIVWNHMLYHAQHFLEVFIG